MINKNALTNHTIRNHNVVKRRDSPMKCMYGHCVFIQFSHTNYTKPRDIGNYKSLLIITIVMEIPVSLLILKCKKKEAWGNGTPDNMYNVVIQ